MSPGRQRAFAPCQPASSGTGMAGAPAVTVRAISARGAFTAGVPALGMTGDNRASAALLLGLSRQSLYVKLRRYGMVSAGAEEEES